MAAPRMASDGKDRGPLHLSLRRLRDEIIGLYFAWREEAAARSYADLLASGERSSHCWEAR